MSIKFNDLKLESKQEIETIEWGDQKIEIKQYLPVQNKLDLITTIVNDSIDANNFYNPAKIYIYSILEIIFAYTNIELNEEQMENPAETYDLLVSSGLSAKIFEQINPYEYQQIKNWVNETIDSLYKYKQSVLGVLETVRDDYSDAEMKAEDIQKKLTEHPEDLQLLKDIMDKLG